MKVLITGASGAIGSALARKYATKDNDLYLFGRDPQKLKATQALCSAARSVKLYEVDLSDIPALKAVLDSFDTDNLPDICIANAGMNTNIKEDFSGEDWEASLSLLNLNVTSTILMTSFFAKKMKDRGSGHLVLISSLASVYGLALVPSYCASKSAITTYYESIYAWLAPFNVSVSVVLPGNVESDMCNGMPGPKPFVWTPDKAADYIIKRLDKKQPKIVFPWILYAGIKCLTLLPDYIARRILHYLNYY